MHMTVVQNGFESFRFNVTVVIRSSQRLPLKLKEIEQVRTLVGLVVNKQCQVVGYIMQIPQRDGLISRK